MERVHLREYNMHRKHTQLRLQVVVFMFFVLLCSRMNRRWCSGKDNLAHTFLARSGVTSGRGHSRTWEITTRFMTACSALDPH